MQGGGYREFRPPQIQNKFRKPDRHKEKSHDSFKMQFALQSNMIITHVRAHTHTYRETAVFEKKKRSRGAQGHFLTAASQAGNSCDSIYLSIIYRSSLFDIAAALYIPHSEGKQPTVGTISVENVERDADGEPLWAFND